MSALEGFKHFEKSPTLRALQGLDARSINDQFGSIGDHYATILENLSVAYEGRFDAEAKCEAASGLEIIVDAVSDIGDEISDVDNEADAPISDAVWAQIESFVRAFSEALRDSSSRIERRHIVQMFAHVFPILLTAYLHYLATLDLTEKSEEAGRQRSEIERSLEELKALDHEHQAELERQFSLIDKKIDDLAQDFEQGQFYVVDRPVPLGLEKRFGTSVVRWLVPGEEVEVLQFDKKWVQVVALDVVKNQTQVGWVLKKYLRRLKR